MEHTIAREKQETTAADLALAALGAALWLTFEDFVLPLLSGGALIFARTVSPWLMFLPPAVRLIIKKEKLHFSGEDLPAQVLSGVIAGIALAVVLAALPAALGAGEHIWHHFPHSAAEAARIILALAPAEELLIHGYVYEKLKALTKKPAVSFELSVISAGLLSLLHGGLISGITGIMISYALFSAHFRFKNMSLLSVVVAHTVYDIAAMAIFAAVV